MRNKKSQIQMGENVIILFIFFILLVFAVVFYTRIQSTKTQQQRDIDITGRGLEIAQKVSFLPELQCTKDNAEVFTGCYDENNLKALDSLASKGENREYYFNVFGFSRVSVKKVFPVPSEDTSLIVYDNPKGNFTSVITTNVPITLCDFISGIKECEFGVLKVEVYN